MYNYAWNYVINHLQLNSSKKNLKFDILYTKKILHIIKFFKRIGLIKNFYLFRTNNLIKIKIFIAFHKKLPLCKHMRLISTPSRFFFISYKALLLLHNRTLNSFYVLSTPHGLISHVEALKLRIGGKLMILLSI